MGGPSCAGGEDYGCRDGGAALRLKLVAIAAILVGSFLGVCIPIAGESRAYLKPDGNFFRLVKSFAAGVILATGFVHVLPDAFESLSNRACLPENPWSRFPFAGFVAMVAALVALFVDVAATDHCNRASSVVRQGISCAETEVGASCSRGHEHLHEQLLGRDSASLLLGRQRVIAQVLEVGIVVHSVIIGVSLGASESPCMIRPLVAALTFHQFFEGMGLGGCIAQAAFRSRASAAMAVFFSLTTPLSVALGIGIAWRYNKNSPAALVVEGILNSASAGILIYMALVDLIGPDFISNKMHSPGMKVWACIALVLGANCMSLLAYWA